MDYYPSVTLALPTCSIFTAKSFNSHRTLQLTSSPDKYNEILPHTAFFSLYAVAITTTEFVIGYSILMYNAKAHDTCP